MIRSWEDAEHLAVAHMRELGFDDAAATRTAVDGGVDVVAEFAAAQVKHYQSGDIGAPAVQQLLGAAHGRRWALFYTAHGYTPAAVRFSDEAGVALFVYTAEGGVRAANGHARDLVTDGIARRVAHRLSPIQRRLAHDVNVAIQSAMDSAGRLVGCLVDQGLIGSAAVSDADFEEMRRRLDRSFLPLNGSEVRDLVEVIRVIIESDRVLQAVAERAGLTDDEFYVISEPR